MVDTNPAILSPKVESVSPSSSNGDLREIPGGVVKSGSSVEENGDATKVPAFLNKLFSMVSDTATDELIYWADSGSSFFVPNHERFGKELLPRFFKHSNFSSFVRQLNMYGFHKVPHLQAGVLKNESPSELWEFINPFFKRGQPQLLARVTRKNNRPGISTPQNGSAGPSTTRASAQIMGLSQGGPYLITDGTTEGEVGTLVGTSGQMLDLGAITSGIAAIRQTQASIGADMKSLQASQDHLWREALEMKDRQRKHEETIDLIVTFLERLFGTEGEGLKGLKEAMRRGALGRTREESGGPEDIGGSAKKRRRLGVDRMISDGRDGANTEVDYSGQIVELPGDSSKSSNRSNQFPPTRITRGRSRHNTLSEPSSAASTEPWTSSSQRFTNLPTEDNATPFGVTPNPAQNQAPGNQTLHQGDFSPMSDTECLHPTDANALAPYGYSNSTYGNHPTQPLSPTTVAAAAATYNLDPGLLQTTIGSLLQSPAAAQMFLNSLTNSAQAQAIHPPARGPGSHTQPLPMQSSASNDHADPTMALLTPLPNQAAMMQNQDDLLKSYQDAVGINGDVDKLQESIDSLVRSMGLDLPTGQAGLDRQALGTGEDQMQDFGQPEDFDVDEFLQSLTKMGEEADAGS